MQVDLYKFLQRVPLALRSKSFSRSSENNLERNGVEEHCEKPVETDGRQFNVDVLKVIINMRQFSADELLEDLLVSASTCQRLVKVVR